jgi:putative membrane protein
MTGNPVRSTDALAQDRTDLALDRTVMAAERNLMAWVRTALSMISFGFTIYKFLESFPNRETLMRPQGPRNVGLLLISMGVFSLVLATIQYVGHLRRLGRPLREAARSISLWVAAGVGLFGLLSLLNVVFQLGPF